MANGHTHTVVQSYARVRIDIERGHERNYAFVEFNEPLRFRINVKYAPPERVDFTAPGSVVSVNPRQIASISPRMIWVQDGETHDAD